MKGLVFVQLDDAFQRRSIHLLDAGGNHDERHIVGIAKPEEIVEATAQREVTVVEDLIALLPSEALVYKGLL